MISCRLKRGARRQQMSILKQQQSGLIPQNIFRERRFLGQHKIFLGHETRIFKT
jgi:hypothetical protein